MKVFNKELRLTHLIQIKCYSLLTILYDKSIVSNPGINLIEESVLLLSQFFFKQKMMHQVNDGILFAIFSFAILFAVNI